jgi:TolB protein
LKIQLFAVNILSMKKLKYSDIFTVILFIICQLIFLPARAELYMELTQGVNQAIPLAVNNFTGTVVLAPGGQTIDNIVRNDLRDSGQFQLVTGNGADYTLQGHITVTVPGHYSVSVELKSAFNAPSGASPVLFNKVFQVKKSDLRQLAHTISDIVYEQLTGVRGIFNTKMAYILKQWPRDSDPIYALEVADADGYNPQTLLVSPSPIMSPTWSPNGQNVAYVSFEHNHASIYLQNLHTGSRRLITSFEGINGAPAFSPDGSQMAVVLTKTGNPKIYVVNLATLQLRQITNGYSIDTEPRWTADGRSLIFTSDRSGNPQIYRYDFDSGKITRLTYQGNYNARASITADGRTLVFMHRETNTFGIAKQDLATGRLQILTSTGTEESPSLAPNGKMVLYATEYQGRGILGVVSIDGRVKLRLPSRAGTVQEPAWSPYLLTT